MIFQIWNWEITLTLLSYLATPNSKNNMLLINFSLIMIHVLVLAFHLVMVIIFC